MVQEAVCDREKVVKAQGKKGDCRTGKAQNKSLTHRKIEDHTVVTHKKVIEKQIKIDLWTNW